MKIIDVLIENIKKILLDLYGIEDSDSLVMIEIPKDNSNGDYSSNIAMRLTKKLNRKPVDIANEIKEELIKRVDEIDSIDIAGPGFINFWMKKGSIANIINTVLKEKDDYGKSKTKHKEKYLEEYVSANPTGPLHCGHARGAAWGDSVARILKAAGYDVVREYYINDAGGQIYNLGASVYGRYLEAYDKEFELPEDGYHGPDVIEIAKEIKDKYDDKFLNMDKEDAIKELSEIAKLLELDRIKEVLKNYRCEFDSWISETWIRNQGLVEKAINKLNEKGYLYEKEDALWFKTSEFGDDKDRVLRKSNGLYTYLAPDIANHIYKFERGYDILFDIWGADHHSYITRMKAALQALGYNPDNLIVDLNQIVRMMDNGQEVKMSKRLGNALSLQDLIDDIGVDAARYFFLSKALDTHMDFDLGLARSKSNDNPIYYIQYAYARICSVLNNIKEYDEVSDFSLLNSEKEIDLLKHIASFNEIIEDAAITRAPNKICNYVYKLANYFHSFYGAHKIIDEDNKDLTNQRIALIKACAITIKNALDLLGIEAPEHM